MSADGRFVTFLSDATNLFGVTATNTLHIYYRDLQAATTLLVDVTTNGTAGADQLGNIPSMSADGQSVVFATSDSSLVPADNNEAADVFLWSALTGTNLLVSTHNPLAATPYGNASSALGPVSLSGNGRLVAFASYAGNLVTNDPNGEADVFVRDRVANNTTLVSVGLNGNSGQGGGSYSPIISADGRYVVFASGATNLVAGDTNGAVDIFRRDLQAGTTALVSLVLSNISSFYSSANPGYYDASFPVCSQDGRYVAFLCHTNGSLSSLPTALFWRDMNTNLTYLISRQCLQPDDHQRRWTTRGLFQQSEFVLSQHPGRAMRVGRPGARQPLHQRDAGPDFRCDCADGNPVALSSYQPVVHLRSGRGLESVGLPERCRDEEHLALERRRPLCRLCQRHQSGGRGQQREQ